MKKKFLIGAAITVVVILVGVGLLILSLNSIARTGVTRGGSAVLGVPVTLDKADVSLRGLVELDTLAMGSPEEYTAPHMLHIGRTQVEADVTSFLSDRIVLRDVIIEEPEFTLELKDGKANWTVLLERLQSKSEETPPEEGAEGRKMRIDHFLVRNGKVHIAGLPTGEVTVPLPDVELNDIGKEKEENNLPDTMLRIVRRLYAAILKGANDVLPKEQMMKLTEDATDALGQAAERFGQTGQEAGQKAKEAIDDAVGGAAEKGRDALGGWLGDDKKEEK